MPRRRPLNTPRPLFTRSNAVHETLLSWLEQDSFGSDLLELREFASQLLYDAGYHEEMGDEWIEAEADDIADAAFDIWDSYRLKVIREIEKKLPRR